MLGDAQILIYLVWFLSLALSISIHEASHGLMANYLGDPTARLMGRISLNPIRHIDPIGTVLLPILTLITIGFPIGFAKPVPYNPLLLRNKRFGPTLVALAGPASNFLLAVTFSLPLRFLVNIPLNSLGLNLFISFCIFTVFLNLILMVINLIPIPPADGSKLLYLFLSEESTYMLMRFELMGMFFLFLFIFLFANYIFGFIFYLAKILLPFKFFQLLRVIFGL